MEIYPWLQSTNNARTFIGGEGDQDLPAKSIERCLLIGGNHDDDDEELDFWGQCSSENVKLLREDRGNVIEKIDDKIIWDDNDYP